MTTAVATIHNVKLLFRRGDLRQIGSSALFGAVVLLLCGMVLLGSNITRLRDSYAWVQRSNAILLQLAEVDSKLVGVEMTVRGYALTDDPMFLKWQKDERKRTLTALSKLAVLLGNDPMHTDHVKWLRTLVGRRLALYAHLSALGPGHAKEVAAAIRDPVERSDMLNARLVLEHVRAQELTVLNERQATAAEQSVQSYKLAFGIVVLAFVLSALGFTLMFYAAPKGQVPQGRRVAAS